MTDRRQPGSVARSGAKPLIAGVALALTGVISIAALVVQLLWYEPACDPVASWSFTGACGVLRLLVLLMLPILAAGLVLLVRGLVLVGRERRSVAEQREARQQSRR
jgi:hypothetical protein